MSCISHGKPRNNKGGASRYVKNSFFFFMENNSQNPSPCRNLLTRLSHFGKNPSRMNPRSRGTLLPAAFPLDPYTLGPKKTPRCCLETRTTAPIAHRYRISLLACRVPFTPRSLRFTSCGNLRCALQGREGGSEGTGVSYSSTRHTPKQPKPAVHHRVRTRAKPRTSWRRRTPQRKSQHRRAPVAKITGSA